jgi:hypothetical protein
LSHIPYVIDNDRHKLADVLKQVLENHSDLALGTELLTRNWSVSGSRVILNREVNEEREMQTVRGFFESGVAKLSEPISGHEGQPVLITFLETKPAAEQADAAAWASLENMIQECACETGITDLAHQHDHYLHGNPHKP